MLPHKRLCAHICTFKESFGTANWSLMWTPDFTYAQFKDMCTAKNVDTVLIREISNTISSIRLRQDMLRQDLERAGASQIERLRTEAAEKLSLKWLEDCQKDVGPEMEVVIKRNGAPLLLHRPAID